MNRILILSVFSLMLIIPAAQADTGKLDHTNCRFGAVTPLVLSKPFSAFNVDLKGINLGEKGDPHAGTTSHCIGFVVVDKGKGSGNGVCKNLYPNGDFTVNSWISTGPGKGKWEFLFGTGAWEGVTGGGTYESVLQGPPPEKGDTINCVNIKGTYEVPSKAGMDKAKKK